jgi:beta-RFAP synthase
MAAAARERVYVEAPARLHFGVLDLRGALGRRFGGIGATAPGPSLLVSAEPHDTLDVTGEAADRAADFARKVLDRFGVAGGARLHVHRMFPSHAGLGSGTQLALAIGRALSDVHGLGADAPAIAVATGRARRSAIGTWTFDGGGLVVEGGRVTHEDGDDERVAPLIARLPFPSGWHCVVGVPHADASLNGSVEAAALASLPPPPDDEVRRVAHLTLMALLPALVEADLATFGFALSKIQTITGAWFAPIQGGVFAPGWTAELVRRMTEWGAAGVGQSSWGPTVYGIAADERAGRCLADRVRTLLGGEGVVFDGPFRNDGARVWRARGTPTDR